MIAERYRGTLAGLPGEALGAALRAYETLSETLGKVGSYAQLHYVGDTTDPVRAKFYGDVQDRIGLGAVFLAETLQRSGEAGQQGTEVERFRQIEDVSR